MEGRKRFEYATCAPVFFRKRRIKSVPFSTTSGSVWTGPHFVSAYLHSHSRCKKCFYHRVTKETVVVPGALLGPEISVAFSSRKFHRCCTGKSVKALMKSYVIQETQQRVCHPLSLPALGPLFTSGIAELASVKIMRRVDTQREAFPRGWWFSRSLVYFLRLVSNTWGKRKTTRALSPSYLNQRWIALSNCY